MKTWLLGVLLVLGHSVSAQVEVFRNSEDTSSYIAPEDTMTRAPYFGASVVDFLTFIEVNFNLKTSSPSINYAGDVFYISFFVDKDGSLSDYELISFTDVNIASELERVVMRMPKWEPGYLNGKKKRTKMFYKLNIKQVNDFRTIEVTLNENNYEYDEKTKLLKYFIVSGSVLVIIALWIIGK